MAPSRALWRIAASSRSSTAMTSTTSFTTRTASRLASSHAPRNALPSSAILRAGITSSAIKPLTMSSSTSSLSMSSRRSLSSGADATSAPEPPDYLNEAELAIFNKLKEQFRPVHLEVQDISGGCGSMYALNIESSKFKGLNIVKQHKLVNEVLAEDIKGWHGVQLRTKPA